MNTETKVLEVGSAPGNFLIQMRDVYGIDPYGVEYSPAGTEINRKNFQQAGIHPDNIINADFFSPEFQAQYHQQFDVVISRGFIEHFEDMDTVIDAHLNLLKKEGTLIITIPNLSGINYGLLSVLHKEVIGIHNLKIMKQSVFKQLFKPEKVQPLYSGFFGTFDFTVLNAKPKPLPQFLLKVGGVGQRVLNSIFRIVPGKRMLNSQYTSPYLIFIGKKI